MISHLSGTVLLRDIGLVVLDVGGVGYRINVSSATFSDIPSTPQAPVSLWTHLAVRETSLELFGFSDRNELEFFEMLISVSGIGPRSALAILSLATVETLRTAISASDTTYLTKVSGIGKKTAEKIILELRDKVGSIGHSAPELKADGDVIEVLMSLGYSREDARDAMRKVPAEATGTSARVKEALRILGDR
jgi:Holliday junction DNA helicase RuvA